MSERPKGFQSNLDTTIIKNSPDWFRNSLNVRDYSPKTQRIAFRPISAAVKRPKTS